MRCVPDSQRFSGLMLPRLSGGGNEQRDGLVEQSLAAEATSGVWAQRVSQEGRVEQKRSYLHIDRREARLAEQPPEIAHPAIVDLRQRAADRFVSSPPVAERQLQLSIEALAGDRREAPESRFWLRARLFRLGDDGFSRHLGPVLEHGVEERSAVSEVPIEAPFRDGELLRERFDTYVIDAATCETAEPSPDPVATTLSRSHKPYGSVLTHRSEAGTRSFVTIRYRMDRPIEVHDMTALHFAFALTMLTAAAHSYLSERVFLRPLRAETTGVGVFSGRTAKKLAVAMFHLPSLCWGGMAISLLLLEPGSGGYRGTLQIYAVIYALSGIGNFWAVGKPHPGGVMLLASSALILVALYL